jgi:hypothetical protein
MPEEVGEVVLVGVEVIDRQDVLDPSEKPRKMSRYWEKVNRLISRDFPGGGAGFPADGRRCRPAAWPEEIVDDPDDLEKGGPGDERKVEGVDEPFKINIGQVSSRKVNPRASNFFSRYRPYMEGMSTAMCRLR